MSKEDRKSFWLEAYCEVWKWEFNFFLGWDWDNYCKHVHAECGFQFRQDAPLGYCCSINDSRTSYIWVGDADNSSTLAHECIHAAVQCLCTTGVEINQYNDETLAMLVTWLMKEARMEKHR